MQGVRVRSLVGEVRSRMLHGTARKKKKKKEYWIVMCVKQGRLSRRYTESKRTAILNGLTMCRYYQVLAGMCGK